MSYQAQAMLTGDTVFTGRSLAAAVQQAMTFVNDARPGWVATALAVMRNDADVCSAFIRLNAAGPGIAERVDNGDGTVDQSRVTDADLLALTQANWPVVAGVFNPDDAPTAK